MQILRKSFIEKQMDLPVFLIFNFSCYVYKWVKVVN